MTIARSSRSICSAASNRPLRRLSELTAVAALAITLGGACSAASEDGTADPPASVATTPDSDRAAVERAYQSAIEAFEASLMSPEAGTERLDSWWAEDALAAVRSEVNSWAGFGQVLRYPETSQRTLKILSVEVAGESATLSACFVDDGQIVDQTSGQILNDEIATVTEAATLRLHATGWVVTDRSQADRRAGVSSCGG